MWFSGDAKGTLWLHSECHQSNTELTDVCEEPDKAYIDTIPMPSPNLTLNLKPYKNSAITIIPQFTIPNVQCRSCRPLYHVMALLQMKNSLDCRRKAHPSLRTLIGVGGRLETAGCCVFGDSKPRKMGEKEEGCQRVEQRGMNNAG
ncbi:hypothetical protein SRHO_G00163560 [Serrasalmus rhombeus]